MRYPDAYITQYLRDAAYVASRRGNVDPCPVVLSQLADLVREWFTAYDTVQDAAWADVACEAAARRFNAIDSRLRGLVGAGLATRRLAEAVAHLGEDALPRPGFEERVMDAIDNPPPRPWWRRWRK